MSRRFAIIAVLPLLLLGARPGPAGAAADDYFFGHDNVMGTSLELTVRADDAPAARRAEARVLREIDRLAAIFSSYDPASEFRRWQAAPAGPSKVSAELFELLGESDAWREQSGGAFDPRVQALSRLWADGRPARTGSRPRRAMDAASTRSARPAWRLDPGSGPPSGSPTPRSP